MDIAIKYSYEADRGILEGFKDHGHKVIDTYYCLEPNKFNYTIYNRHLLDIFGAHRILRFKFNRKIQELIDEGKRWNLLLFIKSQRISCSPHYKCSLIRI
ncbi:MAG: hypothetical protein JXB49_13105 [Bacteroidales bacterium]|nr:hypothetical protein [Bacteroidales bacterium]